MRVAEVRIRAVEEVKDRTDFELVKTKAELQAAREGMGTLEGWLASERVQVVELRAKVGELTK